MVSQLGQLVAADIMSREVLQLTPDTTLRVAADALVRARVSGVPVVDGQGKCVGVFSVYDLARWIKNEGRGSWMEGFSANSDTRWDVFDVEILPNEEIREYMTADPVTASPDTSVTNLAKMMIDGGVHRVVILDQAERPAGMVSSMDILALMAREE